MTQIANIAGIDGSVMVPVLNETGHLLAYLLWPNPQNILQECYPFQAIARQCAGNSQAIATLSDTNTRSSAHDRIPHLSRLHKDFTSWTGQLFLSPKKQNKMATEEPKGLSGDRILNDPNFERTRENMYEFGRAGKAASLTREMFRDVTVYAKDQITQARLLKVFKRIISTDTVNKRGERTVGNGDHLQLKGFNFNGRAGLRETLYARCPVTIDRATGQATVSIPSFVPRMMVQAPQGTSHFRIVAGVAAVNFDSGDYVFMRANTDELPWDQIPTTASNLVLNFPANSPDTIIVALGVGFFQQVNGDHYPLKTGRSNAATIIAVNKL